MRLFSPTPTFVIQYIKASEAVLYYCTDSRKSECYSKYQLLQQLRVYFCLCNASKVLGSTSKKHEHPSAVDTLDHGKFNAAGYPIDEAP